MERVGSVHLSMSSNTWFGLEIRIYILKTKKSISFVES